MENLHLPNINYPKFDVFLAYAYVGAVCILIIALIHNRVRSTKYQEVIDQKFCILMRFFMAFSAIDVIWGLAAAQYISMPYYPFVTATYAFHTMAAWSAFMCSQYAGYYMKLDKKFSLVLTTIRIVIIIAQMLLLYSNLIWGEFFTITLAGTKYIYRSTSVRLLSFFLQFCHYVPLVVYAVGNLIINRKKKASTYLYTSTLLFALVLVFFGVLQMLYPDGPFYSLGFTVFSVIVYGFNITAQREEYVASYYALKEQEQSRKQIENALEQAKSASAAKTTFLSNMSHDIRTPINGIMGMVMIAKKEEMSPKAAECIDKIDGVSHHLLSLINDVLDMSRIESGKIEITSESMDVRALADNCSSIILGQLDGHDIKYICDSTAVTHSRVLGDPLHLRQILINILGNAVKFTPDGGSVTFTEKEEAFDGTTAIVSFTVQDTGIGMKPEYLDKIFDAFSQENGGSRSNYKGTGLGMAITKQLVELMHGKIEVASEYGKGSVFTVTIPFAVDTTEQQTKTELVDVDLNGVKVLLVEDNELNTEIAVTILEDNGMKVTTTENGRVAVDTFINNPAGTFDVILMDIMMPEMNGYEATKAIRGCGREDAAHIPIIAMTANAFDEDKRSALAAGMNSHVSKPINITALLRELGKYMNQ